jgi:hypothetical protein
LEPIDVVKWSTSPADPCSEQITLTAARKTYRALLEIKPSRLHVICIKSILKTSCPPVILTHWSYWPKTVVMAHHRNAPTTMMVWRGLQMRGLQHSIEARCYVKSFKDVLSPTCVPSAERDCPDGGKIKVACPENRSCIKGGGSGHTSG